MPESAGGRNSILAQLVKLFRGYFAVSDKVDASPVFLTMGRFHP
jgi:hypothetical protein